MKHIKTIIALAILVAVVPFLGLPSAWKNILLGVIGGAIAFLAYRLLSGLKKEEPEEEETQTPIEEVIEHE